MSRPPLPLLSVNSLLWDALYQFSSEEGLNNDRVGTIDYRAASRKTPDGSVIQNVVNDAILGQVLHAVVRRLNSAFQIIEHQLEDMSKAIADIGRVLPKLSENPKAQIVADMLEERRFVDARRVIAELEAEAEIAK